MPDISSNLSASTNPAQPVRCRHIKVDGTQCGCPALSGRLLCYFHYNWQLSATAAIQPTADHVDDYCDKKPRELLFAALVKPLKREQAEQAEENAKTAQANLILETCESSSLLLPVLEDANSVQLALMKVMRLLLANAIPYKTAGLLLCALQTASVNLARINFQPPPDQVITVPFKVPVHQAYERDIKDNPDQLDAGKVAPPEPEPSKQDSTSVAPALAVETANPKLQT
ncbi:MAG: hypothetical protein WBV46_05820 [Terriglobales bacterium]